MFELTDLEVKDLATGQSSNLFNTDKVKKTDKLKCEIAPRKITYGAKDDKFFYQVLFTAGVELLKMTTFDTGSINVGDKPLLVYLNESKGASTKLAINTEELTISDVEPLLNIKNGKSYDDFFMGGYDAMMNKVENADTDAEGKAIKKEWRKTAKVEPEFEGNYNRKISFDKSPIIWV